jgi:hypothetical protein
VKVVVGAVLVVAGAAALVYGLTRGGGAVAAAPPSVDVPLAQLDGDLKAAIGETRSRAETLADVPQVESVFGTSAQTAHDMVDQGELKFAPMPGETIALDQVAKGGGAAAENLLVLPNGAPHAAASQAATTFEYDGHYLFITVAVEAKLKYGEDKYRGLVVITRKHDLQPELDKLVAAGLSGRLDVMGRSQQFGSPIERPSDRTFDVKSVPEMRLVVTVSTPLPAGLPMPLLAGGGVAALIGLVLVIVGRIGGRPRLAVDPARVSSPGMTQLSGQFAVAGGTPSPTGTATGLAVTARGVAPGAMIGRWEVVRQLGSGGMADVFLARAKGEAGFEKLVAIKVMHPHLARNERAVELFLDEARLAARITHANVVAIQDLGKIGEDYVIVMEYVDGVDLDRLLAAGRAAERTVPVDVALGILCRVCDGLHAAHNATASDGSPLGIVHRDVKSANVLVSRQGGVKVVDFGIAKAATQSHLTVAGETKGTPAMMAPEQRVGEQVDVRADVYSLAAVAYEMLTGKIVNLDLAALVHLGIDNWPHLAPLSEVRAGLPVELDRIVLGAMAYDREDRPVDCAAFEAALAGVMKQHGLVASDKDIARWVTAEMAALPVAPGASAPSVVARSTNA